MYKSLLRNSNYFNGFGTMFGRVGPWSPAIYTYESLRQILFIISVFNFLRTNVDHFSYYIFSISQGNTQLLTWGGKQSSIYSHFYPLNLTTFNHSTTSKHHFNLSTKLVPGSYYIIRAHIVDVRGCRSRESIFTLPGKYNSKVRYFIFS